MSLDEIAVSVDQDPLDLAGPDSWRFPLLRTSVSWMEGTPIMLLAGEVDLSTASLLQERLEEIIPALLGELVVDLGLVTFFGSTGTSILVTTHSRLRAQGCRLIVFAPTPRIRRLFELWDLNEVAQKLWTRS